MEGSALLAAIAATPDDDDLRLVYADWLTDQGDPRGELVGLQVKLARADADDVVLRERRMIAGRIRGLLARYEHQWIAPLPAATYEFRRGLIEHVDYEHADFGKVAAAMRAHAPLLRSARVRGPALHGVIMSEATRWFEAFAFEHPSLDPLHLQRLAEAFEGGSLRSIDFDDPYIGDRDGAQALARWPIPVRHLGVAMQRRGRPTTLDGDFIGWLGARRGLRSLALARVSLASGFEVPPNLRELEALALVDCRVGTRLPQLVEAMPALTTLAIETDQLSTATVAHVIASCPRLRRLQLKGVYLGDSHLGAIARGRELRRLDISRNSFTRTEPLLELPNLVSITVPNRLPAKAKQVLAARFPEIVYR